ncbi:hypothetical protein BN14_10651 [Rhizoctonia solani AG-1 IB]|uniref:Uncharacterized protein n=1 Tax=Thanatephorus cucumeris (strain AG1-IB / isolate 7/3/14) TaxID=1108050 RepID=M5CB22_THACB|nr:hypothetical protein BN14_10651 [Rhizoctonia solani AG-1 IB]
MPHRDSSHQACFLPNLSMRSRAHAAGNRLRIKFDNPDFIAWRNSWGPTVFFKRLEYRKLREGVQHEFILLRGLSKRKTSNASDLYSVPPISSSDVPTSSSSRLWTTIINEVYEYVLNFEYVLKFEREASPESQINAIVRTEAYDYVEFKKFAHLSRGEQSSTTELTIEFPEPVALEEVIKICSSISKHQRAQLYTLRQFNCFFYCWNIVSILLRLHVDWSSALRSETDTTAQLINERLIKLSDPQRTRPQPWYCRSQKAPEVRPNLALLIAGEYDQLPNSSRPFIELCGRKVRDLSIFKEVLNSLQNRKDKLPLWIRKDLDIVRDCVRDFLNRVADSTTGLAMEGTGELTIDALFWGDEHIQGLSPEWDKLIKKEVNDLLEIFVNSMWETFNKALEQTQEIKRAEQYEHSITRGRRSKALQRMGNSPLVLGTRLIPLGLRAAWNAARVRASLSQGLGDSTLMKLIVMMRTIKDVPNQIHNVSGIAGNFLSVLAIKRDEFRAGSPQPQTQPQIGSANSSNLSLNLGRSTVLGMMTDIDLRRPELEDQVVCELEKSIKNLARGRPTCTMHELRLATLEVLIRLKQTGKSIQFGLRPESVWRICLWYSLGEEIVKTLEEAAESVGKGRIRCWLRTSESEIRKEEQPMLVSEIHAVIRGRIQNLNYELHPNINTKVDASFNSGPLVPYKVAGTAWENATNKVSETPGTNHKLTPSPSDQRKTEILA